MTDPSRRSLARILEWLAYVLGGAMLLVLGAGGLRIALRRAAISPDAAESAERLAIAIVACIVVVAILLPDLLAQARRIKRRK